MTCTKSVVIVMYRYWTSFPACPADLEIILVSDLETCLKQARRNTDAPVMMSLDDDTEICICVARILQQEQPDRVIVGLSRDAAGAKELLGDQNPFDRICQKPVLEDDLVELTQWFVIKQDARNARKFLSSICISPATRAAFATPEVKLAARENTETRRALGSWAFAVDLDVTLRA